MTKLSKEVKRMDKMYNEIANFIGENEGFGVDGHDVVIVFMKLLYDQIVIWLGIPHEEFEKHVAEQIAALKVLYELSPATKQRN